jgi:hypothetical protein
MTTPNTPELVAIYQHIKANPEEWWQATYAQRVDCGTAYCFAGWAVVRAGGVPTDWKTFEDSIGTWSDTGKAVMPDGRPVMIDVEAVEILGITDEQSWELFAGGNDLNDIRSAIFDITGVDPEVTP